jgi:hypothetical protein
MNRVETVKQVKASRHTIGIFYLVNAQRLGRRPAPLRSRTEFSRRGVEEVGSTHALLRILVAETERPPDATPAPKAK